ncbi:hypothetical protein DFJ77DRAFT_512520 [Powellomyces hirtus]|nr:hypothetical protein DFJ77DRAFT_515680 [Powellomyces hirtus]KAI8910588.1 hypothetical protein DFJ77DRAFT_512520 [Powellomyces hirtus]
MGSWNRTEEALVQLGANPSYLNGRPLNTGDTVLIKNGDCINLIKDKHACTFTISEIPFSSVPTSSQFDPLLDFTSDPRSAADPVSIVDNDKAKKNGDESGDSGPEKYEDENESGEETGYHGPLWPEEFSDESDDVIGSGLDEEEQEETKQENEDEGKQEKLKKPKKAITTAGDLESKVLTAQPRAKRARSAATAPAPKEPRPTSKAAKSRVTSYGLYAKEMRTKLKGEYPNHPGPVITKILKRRWFELPDNEREVYEDQAIRHNEDAQEQSDSKAGSLVPERRRKRVVDEESEDGGLLSQGGNEADFAPAPSSSIMPLSNSDSERSQRTDDSPLKKRRKPAVPHGSDRNTSGGETYGDATFATRKRTAASLTTTRGLSTKPPAVHNLPRDEGFDLDDISSAAAHMTHEDSDATEHSANDRQKSVSNTTKPDQDEAKGRLSPLQSALLGVSDNDSE